MQVRVVADQPWDVKADVLVVPILGQPAFTGPLGELDQAGPAASSSRWPSSASSRASASSPSSPGRASSAPGASSRSSPVSPEELDRETVLKLGASAERRLAGREVHSLAIWLEPLADRLEGGAAAVAELVGARDRRGRRTTRRRSTARATPRRRLTLDELILVAPGADAAALDKAAGPPDLMGEGANIARTLANRSSNDVSPEVLAEEAWSLAEKHDLWIDVIGPEKATEMGMGLFMAVGRGSDNPPRMIVIRSGKAGEKDELGSPPGDRRQGRVLRLRRHLDQAVRSMDEMKLDKTGAATVIAAAVTVARLAPGTPLLAVAPAVENMPGSHSTRPGDIVKALNGKRVDITNTDAEGRLILADAMTYAERLGATHLVDIATLTGAVSRALGELVTGAFGTPQDFVDDVFAAGAQAGERYWQLPLVKEYRADMESWYGDIVNFSRNNEGGLVKSALFLASS